MGFWRLAVLGDPVSHSLSPVIQTAALEYTGLDGTYERRQVDEIGMERAVADLKAGLLGGANVTMPHKGLAARLADRCTEEAIRSGGANTLWVENGRVQAHSTDPDGVRFAWHHAQLPIDAPVLLLGAGAAAAAARLGIKEQEVWITARRLEAAHDLITRMGAEASVLPWGTPLEGAVLVNATPLGMKGESLPFGLLREASGLLELAYGHGTTPAEQYLRGRNLPVASGELMLVGQGAASFAIWTGVEVPHSVMLKALERHKRDQQSSVADDQ